MLYLLTYLYLKRLLLFLETFHEELEPNQVKYTIFINKINRNFKNIPRVESIKNVLFW